jgi:hypothetical protein
LGVICVFAKDGWLEILTGYWPEIPISNDMPGGFPSPWNFGNQYSWLDLSNWSGQPCNKNCWWCLKILVSWLLYTESPIVFCHFGMSAEPTMRSKEIRRRVWCLVGFQSVGRFWSCDAH